MTKRLLAVDDNDLILRVVADFFGPHGWQVTTARDGAEGLRAAERVIPDAVVSDVLMPGLDGWTFCERLRERPDLRDVPFVFLTIERELPKRLRGFHLGADDYVSKPFEVEELHARVERLVERRRARDAAQRSAGALLEGSAEHLALSDLLQILALNGKTGTVFVADGERSGRIEFEAGRLVHAACGRVRGRKALVRILGWSKANFRVIPGSAGAEERSIEGAPTNVLMDALVALDDWERLRGDLPADATALRLAPDARERLHGRAVSAPEYDVLARARAGATVGEILEASPHPDAAVAEAIAALLDLRAIEAHAGPAAERC